MTQDDKLERKSWLGALAAVKILEIRPDVTLPALCHELAGAHGPRAALIGERERLRYDELSEKIDRYAAWAEGEGFPPGETITLLMENCPEYAAIWLGVSQAGCVTALLNTALAVDGLVHCINAASSKTLIFSVTFLPVVEAVMKRLPATMRYWMHGAAATSPSVKRLDVAVDVSPIKERPRNIAMQGTAVLIFTSGTTGLPKAARLTHRRLIEWSFWFAGLLGIGAEDRLYDCLPMYHSTGGIVAVGAMLVRGGTVIIRERFSASRFWDDIVTGKCTIFMYIGELCRYLTHGSASNQGAEHQLRLCCGNGLSGDVWEVFQARFQIPRIVEFYAATEGSVSLYNCAGKPGAIGRVPAFLAHNFPVVLVKTDPVTRESFRGTDGLCMICGVDEPGEALGRIADQSDMPSRRFDGYTDDAASNRKILRDVLVAGDAWFRTGDMMRRDAIGFYYFVERLGDTFRWKGENVSAEEVANVICRCPGILGAVVFGVEVPRCEGRAGMAEIKIDGTFSFDDFVKHVETNLPEYARPLFVRICDTLEVTGTFKYKKGQSLSADGLLASATADVWYYDRRLHQAVPFDKSHLEEIAQVVIRA
jgi:fatty-acyl-CoA synthase